MRSARSSLPALAAGVLLLIAYSAAQGPSSASPVPSPAAAQDKNVADFERRLTRINGQIKDLKARL